MTARVLVIRHGSTSLNATTGTSVEVERGWLNPPLDLHGIKSSRTLAESLLDSGMKELATSTMTRAKQTAWAIGNRLRIPIVDSDALKPWNVGPTLEGKPIAGILSTLQHLAANEDHAPPGGEPFAEFRRRFLGYLLWWSRNAKTRDCTVGMVTHTRNTQLAKAWAAAGAPVSLDYDVAKMNDYSKETDPGSVFALEVE